jgi:subtilisin family serine protease
MATPAVAGAAALILQARGKNKATALAVRDLLQTTASPVKSDISGTGLYASLAHQGAGLINAYNAARAKTIVTPGQFHLNDTNYFKKKYVPLIS